MHLLNRRKCIKQMKGNKQIKKVERYLREEVDDIEALSDR